MVNSKGGDNHAYFFGCSNWAADLDHQARCTLKAREDPILPGGVRSVSESGAEEPLSVSR